MGVKALRADRSSDARPRVLFISYNGLIEPLGPTQIVPYLCGLSGAFEMTVLSFEKAVRSPDRDAADRQATGQRLSQSGIRWIALPYHKRPSLPATLFDIGAGITRAARAHRERPFDLLHARGYVPAAIAWGAKRRLGVPFLFDIRGLQAEEYADAGHWSPTGLRFRLTKTVEQRILRSADGIVTLTEAIRPVLSRFPGLASREALPPWAVIPSCVDHERFAFDAAGRARIRQRLGLGDRPVIVYSGSIGTWYLLDEMLAFYEVARQRWPGLFFLALVNRSPEAVTKALVARGVAAADFAVTWAHHDEVPSYLSAADAGIVFIKPCLSKRSSSPTKYAEYLSCGLPLVANGGVGDVDDLIGRSGAGALVTTHSREAYARAADRIRDLARPENRGRWRAVAAEEFSLASRALPAYRDLYRSMLQQRARRALQAV